MSDREEYVRKLKSQIDAWNAELGKLEAEAAKLNAEAKARQEEQLQHMRQQRDEAMDKLVELQKASDDAWDDIRRGIEQTMDTMKSSMEKAWSRFRQ